MEHTEITPKTRRWRTLFRVISVHPKNGVYAVCPGWNHRLAVLISWEQIDPAIRPHMKTGYFYGQICLGADSWEDLDPFINELGTKSSQMVGEML